MKENGRWLKVLGNMLRGLASTYIPGTPAESPMPLWDVKSRNRLEEGELTLEFHSSFVNHAIPCVSMSGQTFLMGCRSLESY